MPRLGRTRPAKAYTYRGKPVVSTSGPQTWNADVAVTVTATITDTALLVPAVAAVTATETATVTGSAFLAPGLAAVARTFTAGVTAGVTGHELLPTLSVQAMFGGVWTDITPYVRSGSISRPGSRLQGPVWQYQAGTCSLTLKNTDGRFDPDNTSSPYWGGSGATRVSTFSATGPWTCPANVTSIDTVECWAPGGGGAADSNAPQGAGGGGSGEYAKNTGVGVTPGHTYTPTIAAPGAGGAASTSGNPGGGAGNASFAGDSVTTTAHGGHGGQVNSGGSPGSGGTRGTGSTDATHFDGGDGAAGGTTFGGGSGSSAGPAAAGNPGSTFHAGATVAGGGPGANGANGATVNGVSPASGPGGGGSGAISNGSNRGHGGAGQAGKIVLTYTVTTAQTQVLPMVPITIQATWAGVDYSMFSGYADGWADGGTNYGGHYDEVTLTATDAFKVFAGINLAGLASPAGAGEDSGARVNRILDAASWSPSARAVTTGDTTLQATSYGSDAMSLLQLTADSELGGLYVDGAGTVTYRHRLALLQDTRSNTVQAVFGDSPGTSHTAGTELAYAQVSRAIDDTTLVNDCQITIAGGSNLQEAEDADSEARFLYPRTYARSDLLLQIDTDALAYAQWIVYVGGGAEDRFDVLSLLPRRDPPGLFPQILGRELGDRIQVWRRPPNVAAVTKDVFIQGIAHTFDAPSQTWSTQWTLTSAAKYGSFFTLDNTTLGKLDAGNAIGF